MLYFEISTVKEAIERLQNYSANWLLPAFVFAANNVGTDELVDMSTKLGTDQFLDRYFHGSLLSLAPLKRGNNLLRPRLKGIRWDRGAFAGDHIIQQDTKMWGNLFSSRGYREMRLAGLIEGEKAIVRLTDDFKPRFETEIPDTFQFEDLLVWLYAFKGFPDGITNWNLLYEHFLNSELGIAEFREPYIGRFSLSATPPEWPKLLTVRPTDNEYLQALAPKLSESLIVPQDKIEQESVELSKLNKDDPIYTVVNTAITSGESLAFLFAGPPGTGKTSYARRLANALTDGNDSQTLFLQFHPAIGYDDFVEGFRPKKSASGGIEYDLAPRLFLKFAELASKNPSSNYVAVIDELNRGDISRVFGEMLTYLETDYRDVKFTLPFSGDSASVPKNLIVVATANPFDRSVTDLDDALLRRFWVVEFEPDRAFLETHLNDNGVESDVVSRTIRAFDLLNQAFPNGFGHTNFLRVRSTDDLAAVWFGRIRLALKRAFIHDQTSYETIASDIEALFTDEDSANADTAATDEN